MSRSKKVGLVPLGGFGQRALTLFRKLFTFCLSAAKVQVHKAAGKCTFIK